MPGLFEQFPHTNLHELNLNWIIDLINQFKEELEDSAVLSVNGQTGHVTLYESENVILPPLPSGVDQWRLVRLVNGQYVGILFYNGNAYFQRGNETMRLLTLNDIPTSAGVVSWNGMTGVVKVTGADIKQSVTNPITIDHAITTEHEERVNADNTINTALSNVRFATEPEKHMESISAVQTYISSIIEKMESNEARPLTFIPDFTDAVFNVGARVYGTIMKRANTAFSFIGSDVTGASIEIANNGIWHIARLATKKDVPIRTTITISLNSDGYFVSQLLFEKVISVTISDTSQIFVGVRRSTAGYAIFYALDGNGQKMVNTSFTVSIWNLP